MKLLMLLTILFCLQSAANGFGQTISITLEKAPLEKAFKEIRRQTGYSFIYTRAQLKNTVPVSCELKNSRLQEALEVCFRNQPLYFVIEDHYIVIQDRQAETITATTPLPIEITGRVVTEGGEPVSGLTVQIKGTANISTTDNNGYFTCRDVAIGDILVITGAEIETKEVRINSQSSLLIKITQKISKLDEVLAIGYGTTTRRFSTGSISKVTSDNIQSQPVTNPLATLQGRVPGLDVSLTSGIPGASINIQIRGQNSINPDPVSNLGIAPVDNPLIIIDGVPFAPQNTSINLFQSLAAPGQLSSYANPYGGISPFNSLNPADIESIEVLRDASETAIYGSRGANGVIIITTKKGKIGKTNLSVNVYSGMSSSTRKMTMMTTPDYLTMRREAFTNDGITPDLDPSSPGYAPELLAFDTTRYTDWKKYFLGGTAHITNINANVTGGTINTQFLIGAGYAHETYIFPGNYFNQRASGNFNLHHRSANDKLELELSANYSYTSNNSSGTPDLLKAFTLPPDYPSLFDENGNIQWEYHGVSLTGDVYANPVGYMKRKYISRAYDFISHFQFSYELVTGLKFRTSLGYNTLNENETSQSPKSSFDPSTTMTSSAGFGRNEFSTWIIEPQLEYKNRFGRSKLILLLGGTLQKNTNSQSQMNGLGYPDDNLLGSISSATIKTVSDNFSEYKYAALFGRINYIISDRYLININGRRDGSSRFGPGKKYGDFYSLGGGWIFSETNFIKQHLKWLNYGKIRASYGTTGNDNIGNYQYLSRWISNTNPYDGGAAYIPQNLPNDVFSWSVNKKLEFGADFAFLANRVTVGVAWFRNRSGNQLISYLLPSQTGFSNVTANFPALVQNTGLELQIMGNIIRRANLNWTSSLVVTIPHNKLVSFPGIENSSYSNIYIVGQSLSVLKGFDYAGINPTTGLYEFRTINGLTSMPATITDYIVIGNRDKKLYGGLTQNLSYGSFALELFFDFAQQKGPNYLKIINNGYQPGSSANQPTAVLNRWRKPGDVPVIQKFASQPNDRAAFNFTNSNGAFTDASYIRFKTVSLSYSLPNSLLLKWKIENCRFFINSQNLFTLTKYEGDPETKSFYSIPILKTIVAGLSFTF